MLQVGRNRLVRLFSAVVLIVLLIGVDTLRAQDVVGRVTDSDRRPIPGAEVVIRSLEKGTVSDAEGYYRLDGLPLGRVEVEFRFLGFETRSIVIDVEKGESRLDVVLTETTIHMDETVITAEGQAEAMLKRSTRSVQVISGRELDEMRGQTLGETLAELPGVAELTTGPSISKPVIRGLHSQRVVVLNAGVAQEGQQWGGEHAPEIDPFSMARVELVRGAAGVEYGIGAIGGVIRIEPEDLPRNAPLSGRFMMNAFSNNLQGSGSVMLQGGPRAIRGLGWRVQGSARKAGSSRTPDYWLGNTGFSELDGSATVGIDRENVGLHAHFSHFATELGLYSGAHIGNYDDLLRAIERGQPAVAYDFTYDVEAPKQEIRHNLLKVEGHYRLPGRDWIDARYGFQLNKRREYDAHRRFGDPEEDPAFSLDLRTHSFDVKLRQRPRGDWIGVVGLSAINQNNENGESGFLIPNFHAVTGGVFAHQSLIRDGWTFEAGARFDIRWMEAFPRERISQGDFVRRTHDYHSVTGVLGAIRQLTDHWSVAANIGSGWRPPGVNELYSFGVHHGTATFEIGDPDLTSERSFNADLTIRHIGPGSQIELSVYNNLMDGYIFQVPEDEPRVTIRGSFPAFRYAQTNAVLRGIDGSASFEILKPWTFGARVSIVRATDREANQPLMAIPADRLRLDLGLDLASWGPFEQSSVEVSTVLVAEQTRVPEGLDYAEPPDGYVLIGVSYAAELSLGSTPVQFGLSIDNLFNQAYRDYLSRYRYFVDDPGRTLVVRVSVPFGSH